MKIPHTEVPCSLERPAYPCGVEFHLELLQVQPLLGLIGVQVVVEVPGGVPKAVEFPLGCQQDSGRGLLVGNAGVTSFPSPVTKGKQKLRVFENPSPVSIAELSAYCVYVCH